MSLSDWAMKPIHCKWETIIPYWSVGQELYNSLTLIKVTLPWEQISTTSWLKVHQHIKREYFKSLIQKNPDNLLIRSRQRKKASTGAWIKKRRLKVRMQCYYLTRDFEQVILQPHLWGFLQFPGVWLLRIKTAWHWLWRQIKDLSWTPRAVLVMNGVSETIDGHWPLTMYHYKQQIHLFNITSLKNRIQHGTNKGFVSMWWHFLSHCLPLMHVLNCGGP